MNLKMLARGLPFWHGNALDSAKGEGMSNSISRSCVVFVGCILAAAPSTTTAQQESAPATPMYYQTYGVGDWRALATERAVEFKTYRAIILSNPSYSDDDKAAKIAAKYTAIENEVRKQRRAEYASVERTVAIGNSCTKGSSGGSKTCDAKCAGAPLPEMYTSLAWTNGWWGGDVEPASLKGSAHQMGNDRVSGDSLVCAGKLKISGKGRKTSYAEGTFRIRPQQIDKIVGEEMIPIMKTVSTTGV